MNYADLTTGASFNGLGTTVLANANQGTFQIRLGVDFKEWIKDQRPSMMDPAITTGEANRLWLHDKLNEFLDACK